jgi:hypothetical protein
MAINFKPLGRGERSLDTRGRASDTCRVDRVP